MVNHAARGRGAENAVRDELGAYGYDVMRSAGSKGAADLIAVGDGFAVLVQVKLVKTGKPFEMPSPAEREQLLRIAARLGNAYPVAACRTEGSGGRPAVTVYRLLTGTGPKQWTSWAPGMVHTEEKQGYVVTVHQDRLKVEDAVRLIPVPVERGMQR